ncbi:hypothetical protein ACRAWF_36025 [Streptomyces sp. L7]
MRFVHRFAEPVAERERDAGSPASHPRAGSGCGSRSAPGRGAASSTTSGRAAAERPGLRRHPWRWVGSPARALRARARRHGTCRRGGVHAVPDQFSPLNSPCPYACWESQ